jgi:ADP-ribosylglycohydrolase
VSGRDSALGALYGLALGDALGMPTQMMSRQEIADRYGALRSFEPAAADHPLAAGMPAASVTDDTEQAFLVARLLVEGDGHIDGRVFARELVRWEDGMRAKGSLDLLGPSTKRAVEAVIEGESVNESGRYGTTNGAAMRVTPVGIAVGSGHLGGLVDRVEEVSRVSHNSGVAIAAASAVATAVSAAIDGADPASAIGLAIDAARQGAERGFWVASADVGARIQLAVGLANPAEADRSLTQLYEIVGTSLASQESVPTAFGIVRLFPGDPWEACLAAASLGGDSDTVAAMVGAIGGALYGVEAFPAAARRLVAQVNSLDVETVVDELLALR